MYVALLSVRDDGDLQYNPASPAILSSNPSPWEINRAESATPTAASSFFGSANGRQRLLSQAPPSTSEDESQSPTSPVRARSTGDLLSERHSDWDQSTVNGGIVISVNGANSGASLQVGGMTPSDGMSSIDEPPEASRENVSSAKETYVGSTFAPFYSVLTVSLAAHLPGLAYKIC